MENNIWVNLYIQIKFIAENNFCVFWSKKLYKQKSIDYEFFNMQNWFRVAIKINSKIDDD